MLSTDIFDVPIINCFRKEQRFLSNFYPAQLIIWGVNFATSEHAYQWAKTLDPTEKQSILFTFEKSDVPESVRPRRLRPTSAGEAKRAGKLVTIRADWEDIRFEIMVEVLTAKFEQNADLRALLLATDDSLLIEGNTWCDNIWGICTCPKCVNVKGLNLLGKALMVVRDKYHKTIGKLKG